MADDLTKPDEYSYTPLSPPESDTFESRRAGLGIEPRLRLIYLFPGKGSDPLKCSLKILVPFLGKGISIFPNHQDLDEPCPPYEAISYVWGRAEERESLLCDEKALRIMPNLASALRRVRLPDEIRVLWADSICINQADNEERSHQVMLMGAIYSQAKRVLFWLGEDRDNYAKVVFGLAKRLSDNLTRHLQSGEYDFKDGSEKSMVVLDPKMQAYHLFTDLAIEKELEEGSKGAENLLKFFQNDWFRRLWIEQEIGYASKALVLFGNSDLDGKAFENFINWSVYKLKSRAFASQGISYMDRRLDFGGFCTRTPDFLDLFLVSEGLKCSDPRDKVFALLAHPSAQHEHLPPDTMRDYNADVRRAILVEESKALIRCRMHGALANLLEVTIATFSATSASFHEGLEGLELGNKHVSLAGMLIVSYLFPSLAKLGELLGLGRIEGLSLEPETEMFNNIVSTMASLDVEATLQAPESEQNESAAILTQNSRNGLKRLSFILSQVRRLFEHYDPSLYPIHRARFTNSRIFGRMAKIIVEVDYNKSVGDVYREFTQNIVSTSGSLRILSEVQHTTDTLDSENKNPSWVPNWDGPRLHNRLGVGSLSFKYETWKFNIPSETLPNFDGNTLKSPGIIVDTISSSTEPLTRSSILDLPEFAFDNGITEWDLSSQYTTAMERYHMYQRVLTADNLVGVVLTQTDQRYNDQGVSDGFAAHLFEHFLVARKCIDDVFPSPQSASFFKNFPLRKIEEAAQRGGTDTFIVAAQYASRNRRVFCTKEGFHGIGPPALQLGDVVCLLPADVPFVLRPLNDGYLLVGECFVDGIMKGEMCDESKIETINIY